MKKIFYMKKFLKGHIFISEICFFRHRVVHQYRQIIKMNGTSFCACNRHKFHSESS